MSFFSLNWFKSKKQQELEELKVEEQRMKNELLRKKLNYADTNTTTTVSNGATYVIDPYERKEKLYSTVKLVNKTLTVVLNDGSILSKPDATADDFNKVKAATTEEEIINICSTKELLKEKIALDKKIVEINSIQQGLIKLKAVDEFVIDGNTLYFKEIDRSVPDLLVKELIHMSEENPNFTETDEYKALKRFFMWCCLNPRAEVANELYAFLKKNSFRITKQGFFVALRNVVTVKQDNKLVHFVSNSYNKVKAVWKKNPENFYVIKIDDDEYALRSAKEEGVVGNLKELYLDLPNMSQNRFTDAHTKTFDIRVGQVVNMPPEECSWSTVDCAEAGLHFTANEIHYVGCGDTSVLILINPMKVVGIGESKGRCYEYLPIMTVPRDEATEILHDLDFDTLELDEDYAIRELEDLENKAKMGFVAESTKHEFNLPEISTLEIRRIVKSLDEMKDTLSKRVVVID